MTGLDTNILVSLMVSSAADHESIQEAIEALEDDLCTTPTNIGECLRVLTHPKVFSKPLTISRAVALLDSLIETLGIRVLEESWDWWKELSAVERDIPGLRGNEVFDARIALCLKASGVKRIYSQDADFRKFSFLKPIKYLKS